ncbi:hypothetical protein [Anaerorhabdus sp.]|uniref:hypothetical protein n=1 Tax=Anaerorhabdus sp. TaxID=1872524 RepID=UPI002FC9623E
MIKFNECDKRSPNYIKQFDEDENPIQPLTNEELADLEDDYQNDLIKEIKSIKEIF